MKRLLTTLMFTFALTLSVDAQTVETLPEARDAARKEINEGARAYRREDFGEAQRRFERALELDPLNKNAPFFVARAIHAQYRPGVKTPENVGIARAAIAAYQRVLVADPESDEAYNATVYLYRMIKEDALERQWLIRRATDERISGERRSLAYTVLASKDWQCSYDFTEQKEVKTTVRRNRKLMLRYVKPTNTDGYLAAQQCVTRGLEFVEKAISLDAESEQAWSFKANLSMEAVKLAEMDRNPGRRSVYQQLADEAARRVGELTEQNRKKKEAEEKRKAAEAKRKAADSVH